MARNGVKTGGRDFVKGQVSNPLGGASYNKDIKKLRKLTNDQISEIGTHLLSLNPKEINLDQAIDEADSYLKKWILKVMQKGIQKGDDRALNTVLDRFAGRVKEHLDISVTPRPTVIRRIDGSETILTTSRPIEEKEEEK